MQLELPVPCQSISIHCHVLVSRTHTDASHAAAVQSELDEDTLLELAIEAGCEGDVAIEAPDPDGRNDAEDVKCNKSKFVGLDGRVWNMKISSSAVSFCFLHARRTLIPTDI